MAGSRDPAREMQLPGLPAQALPLQKEYSQVNSACVPTFRMSGSTHACLVIYAAVFRRAGGQRWRQRAGRKGGRGLGEQGTERETRRGCRWTKESEWEERKRREEGGTGRKDEVGSNCVDSYKGSLLSQQTPEFPPPLLSPSLEAVQGDRGIWGCS